MMDVTQIQSAVVLTDIIICSAAWLFALVPPVLAVVFAFIVIRKRGRR